VTEDNSGLTRAEQLIDFLQDVALGKRAATEREVYEAKVELDQYLPDLPPMVNHCTQ
jgi:hypothetical protein